MMPHSRFGVLALVISLAACSKPDVEACESYIKDGLKAPSTYRQLKVTSVDVSPIDADTLIKEVGLPKLSKKADAFDRLRRTALEVDLKQPGLGLRRMAIDYEAENGFGTPLRETAICAFVLTDGKLPVADSLTVLVGRANHDRLRASLHELSPKVPAPPERRYPCCVE